jgi:hypothetical protein
MRKLTQRLSAIIVAGLLVFALTAAGQALVALANQANHAALAASGDTAEAPGGALVSIAALIARHGREVR